VTDAPAIYPDHGQHMPLTDISGRYALLFIAALATYLSLRIYLAHG